MLFENLKGIISSLQHYTLSNSEDGISDNTFNLYLVLTLQVKRGRWAECGMKENSKITRGFFFFFPLLSAHWFTIFKYLEEIHSLGVGLVVDLALSLQLDSIILRLFSDLNDSIGLQFHETLNRTFVLLARGKRLCSQSMNCNSEMVLFFLSRITHVCVSGCESWLNANQQRNVLHCFLAGEADTEQSSAFGELCSMCVWGFRPSADSVVHWTWWSQTTLSAVGLGWKTPLMAFLCLLIHSGMASPLYQTGRMK